MVDGDRDLGADRLRCCSRRGSPPLAPPSKGGERVGGDGTWEPTVCDVVAQGVTPLAPPSEGGEMVDGDGTWEPTVCDVVAGGTPF